MCCTTSAQIAIQEGEHVLSAVMSLRLILLDFTVNDKVLSSLESQSW